ncbi:hypothetical protein SDRG_14036 [Saprolegnia diclina VS20]|uniref:Uncharacterized protein n=1 Tax=Saprolegnia diclina (strain VS20) TaxID=1156394 RepID=T0REY9_SAPDV|nr:hypothetical protein SDRG_14036 [Saprolegnia diclina VS20]EQC28212.1 hypothetical protein SDRG_14036 [Saprolegnia diclina VS20]|eukprot:XP_008618361.1 hypothetical protein SDRG_14036 [Saprolegnia diclina VS20]
MRRRALLPLLLAAAAPSVRADDGDSHLVTVVLIGVGVGLVVAVALIFVLRKCCKRQAKAPQFEDFVDPVDAMEAPRPRKDIHASRFHHLQRETEATSPSESLAQDPMHSVYKQPPMPTSPVTRHAPAAARPAPSYQPPPAGKPALPQAARPQAAPVSFRFNVDPVAPDDINYGLSLSPTTTAPAPAEAAPPIAPRPPPVVVKPLPVAATPEPRPTRASRTSHASQHVTPPLRSTSSSSHASPPKLHSVFDAPIELPREQPMAKMPSKFNAPIELPREAPRAPRSKPHQTPEMRAAKKAALINQLGASRVPTMPQDPPRRAPEPLHRAPEPLHRAPESIYQRPAPQEPPRAVDVHRAPEAKRRPSGPEGGFLPLPVAPAYQPAALGPSPAPSRFHVPYPEEEDAYLTCVDNADDTLPLGAEAGSYRVKATLIQQLQAPPPVEKTKSSESSEPPLMEESRAHDMIYLPKTSEFAHQVRRNEYDYYPFGEDAQYETSLNTVDTLPLGMEAGAYTKGKLDVAEYERKQRLKADQIKHLDVKVRLDRPPDRYFEPRG